MNPTRLRRIANKYGTPGVLFVGALLLCQSLWRRKPLLLGTVAVFALTFWLFLPSTCNLRPARVSTHFEPLGQSEVADDESEEPAAYRVIDLGALPGGEISEATGISDKGQVAGISEVSGDAFHGFFWDGKMRDIGTLGGDISIAFGVNNSGQVVGIGDDRKGDLHGFVWQNGKMRDIGHLGGGQTLASGMNNRGGVVGISLTKNYEGHAFYWQDGKMRDIGTPKGYDVSFAQDINDSGVVVGLAVPAGRNGAFYFTKLAQYPIMGSLRNGEGNDYSTKMAFARQFIYAPDASSVPRAFAWKNGKFVELRGKRGVTAALAVNNKGQVVGADYSERGDSMCAVLWESEQAKDLPLPSGFTHSFAIDIADDGTIVGGAFSEEDITACVWKGGKVHDLNKLLPSGSGWTLWFADSVNAKGQIVGIGEHNGQLRAFLLDPRG